MTELKFGERQRTDDRACEHLRFVLGCSWYTTYTTRPSGTHTQTESKYPLEVFVTKEIVFEPTNDEGQN